jgi:hypothetical protein
VLSYATGRRGLAVDAEGAGPGMYFAAALVRFPPFLPASARHFLKLAIFCTPSRDARPKRPIS